MEQDWGVVIGGKRSAAVESSYKNRRMTRNGDTNVLGFKDEVLGRGGDEWPFRALQGSCAGAAALPSRPDDATGVLDVDNFFEKEHHEPIALHTCYSNSHDHETTPFKHSKMDSLSGGGMSAFGGGDPYV
jgi:hypothetical protein